MDPHARASASPLAFLRTCLRHRDLITQLVWRDVVGRYRGSVMGLAWSFITPLLMLLIYTFVFSVVFDARWGIGEQEGRAGFAIVLFAGMIVYGLFAEAVNRAPALVLSNPNYVKRVVFPLELLPLIAMGAVLFHFGVSLLVWIAAALWILPGLPWTALLLPLVVLPLAIGTLGLTWVLASLGVYLRDLGHTVGVLTTAFLFLSPVFYSLDAVPLRYRDLLQLNPLAYPIDEARNVLIWGALPDAPRLALYWLASLLVAWAGFWWFQRTRKGFGDVL